MSLTESGLRKMILSEINQQIIFENARSTITEEDRILASIIVECDTIEQFMDRVQSLNEGISSSILGLFTMGSRGPSGSAKGFLEGIKRWFISKVLGWLGIDNPQMKRSVSVFINEMKWHELLAAWRGDVSFCQELCEAIAQTSVFMAAEALPEKLGADKGTAWGYVVTDQFAEAVKSATVVAALADSLRDSVCGVIAELFPKGSKTRKFFEPKDEPKETETEEETETEYPCEKEDGTPCTDEEVEELKALQVKAGTVVPGYNDLDYMRRTQGG